MTTLTAQKRDTISKKENKALRANGKVPVVLYGKKDDALPLTLDAKEFMQAYKEAGESTVVSVTIEGGDKKDVLIHEVATDPVLGEVIHVDLYAIDMTVEVEVTVPLVFVGAAPAEKELGGNLIKVHHELDIKALPKDLPHEIEVSIDGLKTFEDQVHARDIVMPAGVTMVTDGEEVIALVAAAQEETEETAEFDAEAVQVEEKGKKEEEAAAE